MRETFALKSEKCKELQGNDAPSLSGRTGGQRSVLRAEDLQGGQGGRCKV